MDENEYRRADETQPGYLYHKEPGQPRRRRPPRRVGDETLTPPKKGERVKNAHREAFTPKYIIFYVVLAAMIGLLMFAIHMHRSSWETKKRAARSRSLPTVKSLPTEAPSEAAGIIQDTSVLPDTLQRNTLDADTVRQAVYLSRRADKLVEAGAYDQAIEVYQQAIDTSSNLGEIWVGLGRAYMKVRDISQARRAFDRALRINPDDPETLNEVGLVNLLQMRLDDAMGFFEQARQVDPDHTATYYNIAQTYKAARQYPPAREALLTYLDLEPNETRVLRELAFLHAAERDYDGALEILQQGIAQDPEWAPFHLDSAATLALMERHEDAMAAMVEAEKYTSASVVYDLFQQAAFATLRETPAGRAYQETLLEQVSAEETPAP